MRSLLTVLALCLSAPLLSAQQQERTLIDRLLRPNMELQNSAQSKKFVANSATIKHPGTVGTFFLRSRPREKAFADSGTVGTTSFSAGSSQKSVTRTAFGYDSQPNLPPRVVDPHAVDVRSANYGQKELAASNFTSQRSFNEQGKSQKSLDRRNPPLAIDQVRELLNKNK